jgi:citrate lyase beta subunit
MFIYQFIKYNGLTTSEHLEKYSESGAVICFDLEDSIYDWINPVNSKQLKSESRKVINSLFYTIKQYNIKCNFGIRINCDNEYELNEDIKLLSGKKIHTIFLPKISGSDQIITLHDKFTKAGIVFEELLPIIETKSALTDLSSFIKESGKYFNKLAFGHCDYNLNIGTLPFFHQYNNEYWKWANRIIETASAYNKTFINSVFLNLDDNEFFGKMLSHLFHITKNNFGQATLISIQSEICRNFSNTYTGFQKLIDDRSDLSIHETYASGIVSKYEDKSSSYKKNGTLISPQEYIAAKVYLSSKRNNKRKLVFAGGCFPVQYNILFEDLFHQTVRKNYPSAKNTELEIKLIRYERFANCSEKIRAYCDINKVDKLVLHIRPEPVLRFLKLYYKYRNKDGIPKSAFNLPLFKIIYSEKYDIYDIERSFPNYASFGLTGTTNGFKTDLNYLAGTLFGNLFSAIRKYSKLVSDVSDYCKANRIDLIVLGPPVRRLTQTEPLISQYLKYRIQRHCEKNNINFIDTFKETKENGTYFDATGKFATKDYHDFIAGKILQEL